MSKMLFEMAIRAGLVSAVQVNSSSVRRPVPKQVHDQVV